MESDFSFKLSETREPQSAALIDKLLPMAFQMWLTQLFSKDIKWLQARAQVCSREIGEKGDVLMYGSKKGGRAGEVFNRLAEGMACLTLISRHPVPFGKLVFHHTGEVKRFESEDEANKYVWPEKVSGVSGEADGTLQSEAVQAVRRKDPDAATGNDDPGADPAGESVGR